METNNHCRAKSANIVTIVKSIWCRIKDTRPCQCEQNTSWLNSYDTVDLTLRWHLPLWFPVMSPQRLSSHSAIHRCPRRTFPFPSCRVLTTDWPILWGRKSADPCLVLLIRKESPPPNTKVRLLCHCETDLISYQLYLHHFPSYTIELLCFQLVSPSWR